MDDLDTITLFALAVGSWLGLAFMLYERARS